MSMDLDTSILIYGLKSVKFDFAKEQLKKWSYQVYSSLDLQINENLKRKIIGVLVTSIVRLAEGEDFTIIYDLPNLKVVSCNSSGLDFLDINLLNKKNVIIKNCPDATCSATSDIGMILILNVARKIKKAIEALSNPSISENEYMGMDIATKTLGLVGLGKLGQQLAFKASLGFGMKIVYNQRNKRSDCTYPYYESINEMLPVVDFLVLSCSLNPTTKHLIDIKRLKLMKTTAFIINIARGSVVKTNDLVEALRCGFIAGAGMDVTDPEPLPETHPLLHMDNVLILPHIGTDTVETNTAMITEALANLRVAL